MSKSLEIMTTGKALILKKGYLSKWNSIMLVGFIFCSSGDAALTGISFSPTKDVVSVDESNTAVSALELTEAKGITHDSSSGTYYALIGETIGSQKIVEICDAQSTPLVNVKPNTVFLECLTHGPNGLYSIDSLTKEVGRIKIKKRRGIFKSLATLNSPYATMVLAQDSSGEIQYINGQGRFYRNSGSDTTMSRDPNVNFPSSSSGMCGDYHDGEIIAASSDPAGGYIRYGLNSPTTTVSETIIPKFRFSDVTGGKLTMCPTSTPTAAPKSSLTGVRNNVINIDLDDQTSETLYRLEDTVGITKDTKRGNTFAIVGDVAGAQAFVELTSSSSIPIADISPSNVRLSCLTSGPSGIYAVDDVTGTLGKVNKKKGTFKNIASLPGPYSTKVLAQDSNGVVHYIDGRGRFYTNTGKSPTMSRDPSVNFPSSSNGICGDFNEYGEIISAINEPIGGYNVYNFNSPSTVVSNTLSPRTRLNDLTLGSL